MFLKRKKKALKGEKKKINPEFYINIKNYEKKNKQELENKVDT